ncbi:hypothetical protein O181_075516 [Austropuccinia psidii MF-1]|uniref:Uncharacterized protein n=1 Tax=Austropuccinia psidii MF-1 TaxID=1389203 RepID=A0A9Q3F8P0_9BASI|nr:hypothetical protein [Austropuccinia psidii MF-1]
MSSSATRFDLKDMKTALINVDQTDNRIRKRLETKKLGPSIAPHLARDDEHLLPYVEEITSARQIFQQLASHSSHNSWSHTMNIFNTILNANEESQSIGDGYTLIQENLRKLKAAIGGQWNDESLMEIFFHRFNTPNFHQISNAVDARILVNPTSNVKGQDILEIAHRMNRVVSWR